MAEIFQAGRRVGLCLAVLSALVDNVGAQDSSPTGPTWPNMVSNCNAFHTVNGETCWDLTQLYGITLSQFYEWNPDVKDDCGTNYWLGYSYCVGVGPVVSTTTTTVSSTATISTTTTSTSTSSSSTTSRANNTESYSISVPITTWNVTATETISNFPPSKTQAGQPANCFDWYEVGPVDTCDSIVDRSSWMELEDLHAWNPAIGDDCTGLYDGYWICVNVRPASVTIGLGWTTTDAPASVPTLPDNYTYTPPTRTSVDYAFTPSPTQTGIISGCLSFYQAVSGDTCRNIVDGWYLTEKDFFDWNPALQGNCDGLWANYYYCVVGPSGITVGPSYATAKPTASIPSGQTGECTRWHQRIGETCDAIVNIFGTFSREDFLSWNPSVKQDCSGLVDEQWYCVGVAGTPTTRTTPATTSDFPSRATQSGIAADCSDFWLVGTSDTCDSIASANGISLSQLLGWNPAVGSTTCDNLVVDVYVCVGTGGDGGTTTGGPTSSQTTTAGPTSTTEAPISTPTPTQAGMISGCRRFYLAQEGDGCWAIANSAGISLDDFYAWNPPLNGDCTGLWLGYYYCIGLAGTVTTISSGPPVPTQ